MNFKKLIMINKKIKKLTIWLVRVLKKSTLYNSCVLMSA